MTGGKAIRWSTVAAVAGVSVVAGWVSYDHTLAVVPAHDESGTVAWLYPGTIDGLIYSASTVLIDAARRGTPPPRLARWMLAARIGATLVANVASGLWFGPVGALVAAWPALGFGWIPDLFEYVTEAYPAQVILTATAWLEAHPDGVIIIDTLAKVRPSRLNGETAYDHDYRTLGVYHALAKKHPGAAIVIVHHTRKDQSGDFLDSTSGTYGISGSVDTVLVLARKRGETAGVLHVTGRDVDEDEYRLAGFPFWELDGGTPETARQAAQQEAERHRLGDRSTAILDFAQAHGQITTAQAAEILGVSSDQASAYLSRQVQAGRLNRSGRGLFVSCVGSVGTVGSVGDSQQTQQTKQGYEG